MLVHELLARFSLQAGNIEGGMSAWAHWLSSNHQGYLVGLLAIPEAIAAMLVSAVFAATVQPAVDYMVAFAVRPFSVLLPKPGHLDRGTDLELKQKKIR